MSRFMLFNIFAVFQASTRWAQIAAAVCGRRRLSVFLINWADNLLKVLNAVGVCMLCKLNRRKEMQDRRRRRWWRVSMNEAWRVIPLNPWQEKETPRATTQEKHEMNQLTNFLRKTIIFWAVSQWNWWFSFTAFAFRDEKIQIGMSEKWL